MEEHSSAGLTFAPPTRRSDILPRWGRCCLASLWGRFLAATRLSLTRVCEQSAELGEYDFHNHRDDRDGASWHIQGGRFCTRCGKRFRV